MKRSTAISRLADVAEGLDRSKAWPEAVVEAGYVFGSILEPAGDLERLQLAFVVNEPADVVPWMSHPAHLEAMADLLRFTKLPLEWRWRPKTWPVWNHHISRAVRFWTAAQGRDQSVLDALAAGRLDQLSYDQAAGRDELEHQLTTERAVARQNLEAVTELFYDRQWRQAHSGNGVRPEDHLWWATAGYLDLDDALASIDD